MNTLASSFCVLRSLFYIYLCLHCHGAVADEELDTDTYETPPWMIPRECNYQNDYNSYPATCAVTISEDEEKNVGYWSPCGYTSCEITYTNAGGTDAPTRLQIRSYMQEGNTAFAPEIEIAMKKSSTDIRRHIVSLPANDSWREDEVDLIDATDSAVIYVKLVASYFDNPVNFGIIDKIRIISNGQTPPPTTAAPTTPGVTTDDPTTPGVTTDYPTTPGAATDDPTTQDATTDDLATPGTASEGPTTANLTTKDATTEVSRTDGSTYESTKGPTTTDPTTPTKETTTTYSTPATEGPTGTVSYTTDAPSAGSYDWDDVPMIALIAVSSFLLLLSLTLGYIVWARLGAKSPRLPHSNVKSNRVFRNGLNDGRSPNLYNQNVVPGNGQLGNGPTSYPYPYQGAPQTPSNFGYRNPVYDADPVGSLQPAPFSGIEDYHVLPRLIRRY